MADDARTEARLRLIQTLVDHRLMGAYCKCGFTAFRSGEHELHQADALLALFPDVRWAWPPAQPVGRPFEHQLTLAAAPEPVVPEEPQGA